MGKAGERAVRVRPPQRGQQGHRQSLSRPRRRTHHPTMPEALWVCTRPRCLHQNHQRRICCHAPQSPRKCTSSSTGALSPASCSTQMLKAEFVEEEGAVVRTLNIPRTTFPKLVDHEKKNYSGAHTHHLCFSPLQHSTTSS